MRQVIGELTERIERALKCGRLGVSGTTENDKSSTPQTLLLTPTRLTQKFQTQPVTEYRQQLVSLDALTLVCLLDFLGTFAVFTAELETLLKHAGTDFVTTFANLIIVFYSIFVTKKPKKLLQKTKHSYVKVFNGKVHVSFWKLTKQIWENKAHKVSDMLLRSIVEGVLRDELLVEALILANPNDRLERFLAQI